MDMFPVSVLVGMGTKIDSILLKSAETICTCTIAGFDGGVKLGRGKCFQDGAPRYLAVVSPQPHLSHVEILCDMQTIGSGLQHRTQHREGSGHLPGESSFARRAIKASSPAKQKRRDEGTPVRCRHSPTFADARKASENCCQPTVLAY